ncbi:S-layer homology domain-containing protein [Cohnella luojiensis]|uniref:S-layer homology domain-containing protein n=1 Tax=Cohnella luojiensis TaxID=652876 RepID=A0A4Y8M0V8_9BACL|nr:S-layer homology domain-containing protein [Cohnella luojiensis]TFE27856.1 S-layer homology domain-containing protein [Cohnella luojiensis]
MKKWILSVMATMLMVISLPVYAVESDTATTPKFKDVPTTHWAYTSIMQGAGKGYVKGFPNGTFKPNDPVTSSQFISMLILSLTSKDESGVINWSKNTLDLIPEFAKSTMIYGVQYDFGQGSPWYINYVNIAKDFGVINNEFEGRYNEPLTRERTAAIVKGMDEYLNDVVTDAYAKIAAGQIKDSNKIDEFLRVSAGATLIRGIMTGFPDGTWKPKKVITRAEAIAIIERVNNKSIRRPMQPNMTGVFYSDVPSYGYSELKRIVFTNNEMKKVYDSLSGTLDSFQGSYLSDTGILRYYKDEVEKEKDIRKNFFFEDFTDPVQYYDLAINPTGNVYNLFINFKSGSLERSSKPLDQFLSMIFSTNDAATVRKLITDRIADQTSDIKKTVGKREVVISSDGDILFIAISAYQDR